MRTDLKPVRKAVFPVAGLGTRFLPATKVLPKEMLPLAGKPLIQHAVEEAAQAGIEEFIFITGRYKEMLEEHFDYQPELMRTLEKRGKIEVIDKISESQMPEGAFFLTRQAQPLGLGHAIWCARRLVGNEPFAVILPDDAILHPRGCLAQLLESYNRLGGNVLAVMNVDHKQTHKYGVVDTQDPEKKEVKIDALVEKPEPEEAPSTLAVIGRYILQPEIFEDLARFEKGAGGEIQLTDAISRLIGRQPLHGLRFEGQRYDCGSPLGFIEGNVAFSLADPNIKDNVRCILENYLEQHKKDEKKRPE